MNSDIDCSDIPIEWMYRYLYDGLCPKDFDLSKNGVDKINELKIEYKNNYRGNDFFNDFEAYFMAIYEQFHYSDRGMNSSKSCISNYLKSAKTMAKYQNKLSKEDELLFDDALTYIENYKIELPHKDFEPVKFYLPNLWYITPYNHLYNTMGPDGHKEANLIYPLYYSIIRDDDVVNFIYYLKEAKRMLEEGFVNKFEFDSNTNLIYDFISIYPEYYYQMNHLDQWRYRLLKKKTYNPRIVKLIAGIRSAHAGLFSFFYYLKNNSCDYYGDLDFIKSLELDEILVRCCGFHKISSICDKTITTSCINYEEEFEEYIKRGWQIDFVKPIILNSYTKRLEEYPDEFLLIRSLLRNKRV